MANPYAAPQYNQANPYAGLVIPGSGPKPPSGFGTPGNAPALTPLPGGPDDLGYLSEKEKRIQSIAAGIQAAKSMQVNDHSTQNELRANLIKNQQNAAAPIPRNQQFDNVSGLRKELEGQLSVKTYKGAIPSYASALKSPDTPAGDQDMIYAFAKIMDPNSVVREGEANSVADLGTVGQKIYGELQKQLGEGGRFTPELRAQLRNTLANRVGEYDKAYNFERARYRDLSAKQGIDPDLVVGPHMGDSIAAVENKYFRGDPNKSAAAARAEAAAGGPRLPGGPGAFDGPSSTPMSLATGSSRLENDPSASSLIDTLIRHGASADEINKSVTQLGFKPVDPNTVTSAQAYLKAHPNYQGSFGLAQREVQQSALSRLAGSPVGTGVGAAVDAGLGGLTDEIAGLAKYPFSDKPLSQLISEQDAKKKLAFETNPKAAFAGQAIGNIGDMALAGGLLKGTALANSLGRAAPYVGNAAYGAVEGFGQNNNNRLLGAGIGGGAGLVGTGLGELASVPVNAAFRTRPGMAFSDGARRVRAALPGGSSFDNSATTFAPRLSPGEGAAANVFGKAGPDTIKSQLDEASRMGLPFTLADTSPEARELVAAGVRRSPTAAQTAENVLLSRGRGQIDRFGNAIARDLGPVENVPQMSADLAASARATAKPLYEKAYAAGQVDDPAINTLFEHPELRSAFGHAQELHANDSLLAKAAGETPPPPLPQVIGPDGSYTPPDVLAIDYVQRALRGKGDAAYNGDAAAKMSAPFLKDARNLLLARTDAAVPEFAAARYGYGGPMQSKEALEFGKSATNMDPNTLGMEVGGFSPEQFGQAQIGFRSGLMDNANKVRYSNNPFDATLGNPAAEQRLAAMYPDNSAGTANLLRQRDLERSMARTSNDILGNSKTAQRGIADQAFLGPKMDAAVDIGSTFATGGIPVLPAAKLGLAGVKNVLKLGADKRAVAKAEELAPLLLNPDPAASAQTVEEIMRKLAERRAFEARQNITRPAGMFGAGFGLAGAGY